jgi:hypothetical protein
MPPSTIQAGRYPRTGIVGYHAYLPGYRLQRSEIAAAIGSSGQGVRCVAGYDEDSTTLGVAAALPAVRGREPAVGSVWFATTDPVYADKTNTAIHAALTSSPASRRDLGERACIVATARRGPGRRAAVLRRGGQLKWRRRAKEPTRRPPSVRRVDPLARIALSHRLRPSSSTGRAPGSRRRPGRNVGE